MKIFLEARYRWVYILAALGGVYHPEFANFKTWKCLKPLFITYAFFAAFFGFIFLIQAIIHMLFMSDNIYDSILDFMSVASSLQALFRLLWYSWKMRDYTEMFNFWYENFENFDFAQREALLRGPVYFVKVLLISLTTLVSLTSVAWMSLQYGIEDKIMKIPTAIPYRNQSPDYEILLTFIIVGSSFQIFTASALQVVNLFPLIWEAGELERSKKSLQNLLSITRSQHRTYPSIVEEIDFRLSAWIHKHQKLMQFHEKCWVVDFSHSVEMLATCMGVLLIAFIFVLSDVTVDDKISVVLFYAPYVTMFILTCHYAEKVHHESERFFDGAFTEAWSILPKKHRASLLIISQRIQRPIIPKGLKLYPVGFETFSQILNFAFAMFNFLRNTPENGH